MRFKASMLSVYGDDSADETQSRVFVVAGLIGTEQDWSDLQWKWVDRTGGASFHAKDCDSDFGIYAENSHADNKALYRDLTISLASSGIGGYAVAIDLGAHRRLFPNVEDASNLAYYACFLDVLEGIRNCARDNGEIAELVFDMRSESEFNTGLLYHETCELPEYRPFLAPKISFAVARGNPCIQAADLFAREAMKTVDNQFGPVKRPCRKSWIALHDTGRFSVDVYSEEYFKSLDSEEFLVTVENEIGITRERYIAWLKRSRRLANTTNFIRFSRWIAKKRGIQW